MLIVLLAKSELRVIVSVEPVKLNVGLGRFEATATLSPIVIAPLALSRIGNPDDKS